MWGYLPVKSNNCELSQTNISLQQSKFWSISNKCFAWEYPHMFWFLATQWPWMKVIIIKTGIKLLSSVLFSRIPSLKDFFTQMFQWKSSFNFKVFSIQSPKYRHLPWTWLCEIKPTWAPSDHHISHWIASTPNQTLCWSFKKRKKLLEKFVCNIQHNRFFVLLCLFFVFVFHHAKEIAILPDRQSNMHYYLDPYVTHKHKKKNPTN